MASARSDNVATIRRAYDAFNDGDIETVVATMAEDIEWMEPEGFYAGGTYHGPDEVVENVFTPAIEQFESFRPEPERFVADGDTVVTLGRFEATTPEGERIVSPFAHVWELRDGRVRRLVNYTDTALWK